MSDRRWELKPISREGVAAALQKAHRYRILNDPTAAESICLDVLAVDPENAEALVTHVLAITDQLPHGHSTDLRRADEAAGRLVVRGAQRIGDADAREREPRLPLQPRQLMMVRAAVGCKRWLASGKATTGLLATECNIKDASLDQSGVVQADAFPHLSKDVLNVAQGFALAVVAGHTNLLTCVDDAW